MDGNSCLHLYVNGMDQGVAAQDIPMPCYPLVDLYGQCEQVRLDPPLPFQTVRIILEVEEVKKRLPGKRKLLT